MSMFSSDNTIEPGIGAVAKPARKVNIVATEANPIVAVPDAKMPKAQAAAQAPDAIATKHGLYTAERGKVRHYYADYQQKTEVMRADPSTIRTKMADSQTVGAMLDLAQSRGWDTVKLRGTQDFQREAWVQAQVRGMKAEGYKPTATDTQEVARRKPAAAPVAAAQPPKVQPIKAAPAARSKSVWGNVEVAGKLARAAETQAQAVTAKAAATA